MLTQSKRSEMLNGPIWDHSQMSGHLTVLLWTLAGSLVLIAATFIARIIS